MNNPLDVEKSIIIVLNLDLLCHAFFWLGELALFQCMDWRLLSGLYWKNHDSSQVITFPIKFGSFSMFWRMSAQVFIRISTCSGVRSLSTIFKHTFFMLKLLCKICRVFLSMLINSATARMLRWWFYRTISPTFSLLASVFDVLGRPGHWMSPISSFPSLNLLNHSKTWVQDRCSSPQTLFNISSVSVADFSSFTQNFTLTCCSTLTINSNLMENKNTIQFKQRLLPNCLLHDLEIVTVNGGESTSQYHKQLPVAKFTGKWKEIKSGYFIATPSICQQCFILKQILKTINIENKNNINIF